jgi:hypothetical protein
MGPRRPRGDGGERRRGGRGGGEHARLVVVALGAYAVEELAAGAEVEDEVEVVRRLQPDTASVWRSMRKRESQHETRTACAAVVGTMSTGLCEERRGTHLKVVVQGDDVRVSLRDALQDRDLVPDLGRAASADVFLTWAR